MSMELYILSDKKLVSIADWQQAIDADGRALRLSIARPFSELSGALPVVLDGKPTAFECDHWDVGDIMDNSPDISFGRRWKYALAFRWGADIAAGAAAYAAAASYAKVVGGKILDCEEGKIISPQHAHNISTELGGSKAEIEAAVQFVIAKMYPGFSGH